MLLPPILLCVWQQGGKDIGRLWSIFILSIISTFLSLMLPGEGGVCLNRKSSCPVFVMEVFSYSICIFSK